MITDYASLQTEVTDELNRSDLTNAVKGFVQRAEQRLRRDHRTRKQQDRTLTVSADATDLPSDYQSLDSLYHDGPTYFGPIGIVSAAELSNIKATQNPTSGVPTYAAVVGSNTAGREWALRFAPVPNGTFNLHLVYWLKIEALSDGNTTNWLLLAHPDIYFYATLLESAPYLKNDARIPVWKDILQAALEELHNATWNAQWSGQIRRRFTPIG